MSHLPLPPDAPGEAVRVSTLPPVRILVWSVTSALAGFLFGFDTVVISGAEQTIQELWHLSKLEHGLVMGAALYGTIVGALLGRVPTDFYGRKPTLLAVGVLYVISAVGCGSAWGPWSFAVSRYIGGLGIGISTVAAPLYISEIAPPAYRGRLAGLFQFNIVTGIIVAFGSNLLMARFFEEEAAWRWMLGIAAFPSALYTVLCAIIPESPRWLLSLRGDRPGGIAVLGLIHPDASAAELEARADDILAAAHEKAEAGRFWSWELRRPILLAFLIAFFNQLSGINAVLYYSKRIFELAGLGKEAAMLSSVGIGIANFVFTFIGLWLIDRLGRRTLLFIGSFGYIASLGLIAWGFFADNPVVVTVCIFAFIGAHAVGQGAVIWVFIAEIFPNRHRASGQALGSFTHWFFAAVLTTIFPKVVEYVAPGYVFLFFCGMMCLQLLWVRLMVPETKGVPLETLERQLTG